ncbi:MAG: nucleotidyltransferase domain-containing protein [Firmicutes bacterium]|nr:nucleotidyltransferase domain-containing protein [Bacillota bacterium]
MPTPEEISRIRRFLAAKEEKARRAGESACQEILAKVKEAVAAVAPLFPVERVYLYGSTLRGRQRPDSDVDLAVEGRLSPAEFFALWTELDRRLEQEIDLRELSRLPFGEKIKREGRIVYERENPSPAE